MFTVSEKKALKSVLHMSNLTITEHFIELTDLVADIKEYIMQMNLLHYDNKYNNVYDILLPEYHDFADIFKTAEKQSLSKRDSQNHAIDLKLSQ